ncbi:MAG TPA: tetratricopeptide repeat protein [Gammaproteobacteria bacterium]|nr:tetratricopeptide repeat protein [Gammaproteobacteria bacterium]
MTQFWIAALALGLVAAAIVLVPMWRAWSRQATDRSSAALGVGIVVALAVPVLAIMLYAHWTTWDWSTGGMPAMADGEAMHEMDEAVRALERRIAQEPDNLEGWLLLGRSYMSLRRFGEAAQAFRHAVALDDTDSVQILADFGEALALSEPEGLQGEAGAVFERVLTMSPGHPKGLWYGGLNAYENANWALADQRLSLLLTLNPPESLIPLIEERIADARAHTGDAPPPAETDAARPAMSARAPVAAPGAGAAAGDIDGISIEVNLDPALAARIPGPTPIFIIARSADGGPPLAVIRANSAELPMAVKLTDANAMMEGVKITDQAELELVARVSLSGSPAQRPGDLYGAVSYARGNGPTRIMIDRVAD